MVSEHALSRRDLVLPRVPSVRVRVHDLLKVVVGVQEFGTVDPLVHVLKPPGTLEDNRVVRPVAVLTESAKKQTRKGIGA